MGSKHTIKKVLQLLLVGKINRIAYKGCALLFTIFVALKLDKDINWPWLAVFLPLFVTLHQLLIAPLICIITSSISDHDFIKEFYPRAVRSLKHAHNDNLLLFSIPFIALLAFFTTLLLYLTETHDHFWLVSSPLLILIAYLTFTLRQTQSNWGSLLVVGGGLQLTAFVVLLTLKLEYIISTSWNGVMLPLFILKAFCLGALLLQPFLRSTFKYVVFAAILGGIILLPLLALEIMVLSHLENRNDRSFKFIFAPLFALEGIWISFKKVL